MIPLALISCLLNVAVFAEDNVRKPKLFYVSTSATTSTLSTASICYITTAAGLVSCVGRKRRTINFDGMEESGLSVDPSASEINIQQKEEDAGKRDGRFLLYWITTTSISTTTSYTTTLSVSSIGCTPSGGAGLCG